MASTATSYFCHFANNRLVGRNTKLDYVKVFYADDTYAKEDKEGLSPRVNIFGGVLIDKESEPALLEIIKEEKSKFTHPNLPIKWNFKDTLVKEKFDRFERQEEYKKMLANSNSCRREIIKRSSGIDFQIFYPNSCELPPNPITKLATLIGTNIFCLRIVVLQIVM